MKRTSLILLILFGFVGLTADAQEYKVIVLGTAQDGGYPQLGCEKFCCAQTITGKVNSAYVASLAIVDEGNNKFWLVDCTPDVAEQLQLLKQLFIQNEPSESPMELAGIFLTHAHIGHYLGLAQFGREVSGAKNLPVYVMPRMEEFLKTNGPWDQLVKLQNIDLQLIEENKPVELSDQLSISPFLVPHRDEYSETVGYTITGRQKTLTYIPDIDKWDRWNTDVREVVKKSDYSLLDATFYSEEELPGRNMSEIPHPFVLESIVKFKNMAGADKSKVHFIHFNHSNPLLWDDEQRNSLSQQGFNLSKQGQVFEL